MTGQLCLHHPHNLGSPLPPWEVHRSLRQGEGRRLAQGTCCKAAKPTLCLLFQSHLPKCMALLHSLSGCDGHSPLSRDKLFDFWSTHHCFADETVDISGTRQTRPWKTAPQSRWPVSPLLSRKLKWWEQLCPCDASQSKNWPRRAGYLCSRCGVGLRVRSSSEWQVASFRGRPESDSHSYTSTLQHQRMS